PTSASRASRAGCGATGGGTGSGGAAAGVSGPGSVMHQQYPAGLAVACRAAHTRGVAERPASPYAVPLDALVATARVRREDQVEEQDVDRPWEDDGPTRFLEEAARVGG
ncbi:MAG: hypothetical protein JWO60_2280, partial [Frankiales bacterium]|nr:hypothetical protein [Frankiales bacterium]